MGKSVALAEAVTPHPSPLSRKGRGEPDYHGVYLSPNKDSPQTTKSPSPVRANGSK